jgi:hypothetical protein
MDATRSVASSDRTNSSELHTIAMGARAVLFAVDRILRAHDDAQTRALSIRGDSASSLRLAASSS